MGASGRGSECGNRLSNANLLIVFHSNYGSILLSYRDMTIGGITDGRRMDICNYRITGPRQASNTSQ